MFRSPLSPSRDELTKIVTLHIGCVKSSPKEKPTINLQAPYEPLKQARNKQVQTSPNKSKQVQARPSKTKQDQARPSKNKQIKQDQARTSKNKQIKQRHLQ
ncbi:hypothetical protein BCR42DRAFT_450107 [Absidia repens]|uniref:Uncharacterized protein n=1 Tax=Absidia repens TaxID=90262 RepID=A0A1X2IMI5_9FUNG|nr:hypothetical protein BCR42DRAFT_450107 [Absidia repens]